MVSVSWATRKHYQVHRLVAEAFIGPAPEGMLVNHIDGVKSNNRVPNLEYVTVSENNKHAFETGLNRPSFGAAKIDSGIAEEIRLRVDAGEKQKSLASEFGISPQAVNDLVKGRTWSSDIDVDATLETIQENA
jgi:hypothetical protein